MEAHISTSETSGWLVLMVDGDLDLASAPAVRARLRQLSGQGHTRLAVDLDNAGVVDSVGLGLLVGARRRAVEAGGDLVLVCGPGRLMALLSSSGLDRVFRVVASLDGLDP